MVPIFRTQAFQIYADSSLAREPSELEHQKGGNVTHFNPYLLLLEINLFFLPLRIHQIVIQRFQINEHCTYRLSFLARRVSESCSSKVNIVYLPSFARNYLRRFIHQFANHRTSNRVYSPLAFAK
jgi:hypothetical protein